MCWDADQQFPCDSRSPAAARRFCSDELSSLLADRPERPELLDDVNLIVSELMTNSVNAASNTITIGMRCHRDILRLTVSDDAPGVPVLQHPTADQGNGRGLAIIGALSLSWGVDDLLNSSSGKRVWAELPIAPGLTDSLLCTR